VRFRLDRNLDALVTCKIGRTSLLVGNPGADAINWNPNIQRADLELIVTQLGQLRLADGGMPVWRSLTTFCLMLGAFESKGSYKHYDSR